MLGVIRQEIKKGLLQFINKKGKERHSQFKIWPKPELWDLGVNDEGHLEVDGVDVIELVEEFGTPLHVVDASRLEKNYRFFLDCFQAHYPKVEIGYSYKTNPLPASLQKLHSLGASAEVISHFELWLALKLGVPPNRIIFNGPGKSDESLRLAVEQRIKVVNIDGPDEVASLARLAEEFDVIQPVAVRVVTSVGWSGQFGLPIASGAAKAAVELIEREPRLKLIGLHFHLGTGIKDLSIYVSAIGELLDFAREISSKHGIRLEFIDCGGGFGIPTNVPYTRMDQRLMSAGFPPWQPDFTLSSPLPEYAKKIVAKVTEYYDPDSPDSPTLIFEPGRAITGSSQFLLTSVLTIKKGQDGVKNVILDAGRNLIMPPVWQHHAVLPASKLNSEGAEYYNLYGPLCHPGDLLFRERWLPGLAKGDCLSIMDSGAYFIPNQMNFSNPRTAVAMVENGVARIVRERESFETMIAMDRLTV